MKLGRENRSREQRRLAIPVASGATVLVGCLYLPDLVLGEMGAGAPRGSVFLVLLVGTISLAAAASSAYSWAAIRTRHAGIAEALYGLEAVKSGKARTEWATILFSAMRFLGGICALALAAVYAAWTLLPVIPPGLQWQIVGPVLLLIAIGAISSLATKMAIKWAVIPGVVLGVGLAVVSLPALWEVGTAAEQASWTSPGSIGIARATLMMMLPIVGLRAVAALPYRNLRYGPKDVRHIVAILAVIGAILGAGVVNAVDAAGTKIIGPTQTGSSVVALTEHYFGLIGAIIVVVAALILMAVMAAVVIGEFMQMLGRLSNAGYLPHHVAGRGLAFLRIEASVIIALGAAALVLFFQGSLVAMAEAALTTALILVVAGQFAILAELTTRIRKETTKDARKRLLSKRTKGIVLAGFLSLVLAAVLVSTAQAIWVLVIPGTVLVGYMRLVRLYYARRSARREISASRDAYVQPPRVRAMVVANELDRASAQAISWARATSPISLEIVTANIDPAVRARLVRTWKESGVPVVLTLLSPEAGDGALAVQRHIERTRARYPQDLITVVLADERLGPVWKEMIRDRSSARLRHLLLRMSGVVVAEMPWWEEISSGPYAAPGALAAAGREPNGDNNE